MSTPSPPCNIEVNINNVVCTFTLPMHVDLRKLAMNTWNVIYNRTTCVTKQKRNPSCFVKVQSSGKVFIVGCKSEDQCRQAARSIGRKVQKIMGKGKDRVCLRNYRVCNILATCKLPFGIQISEVARRWPTFCIYEPELSVGLEWKYTEPKASLRIHTTGTITVTGATSEENVQIVLGKIFDVVREFKCDPRTSLVSSVRKRVIKPEATDVLGLGIAKRKRFTDKEFDLEDDGIGLDRFMFGDEEDLEKVMEEASDF